MFTVQLEFWLGSNVLSWFWWVYAYKYEEKKLTQLWQQSGLLPLNVWLVQNSSLIMDWCCITYQNLCHRFLSFLSNLLHGLIQSYNHLIMKYVYYAVYYAIPYDTHSSSIYQGPIQFPMHCSYAVTTSFSFLPYCISSYENLTVQEWRWVHCKGTNEFVNPYRFIS